MRLVIIFALYFILHNTGWTQVNPYIIDKVPVDSTAKNSNLARDQALLTGQKTALISVLDALGEKAINLEKLSETQLNSMLVGYEIYDERTSANRYRAFITYHFDEEAVQQWLQKSAVKPQRPSLSASSHDPFDEVVSALHVPLSSSTRAMQETTIPKIIIQFATLEQWTTFVKNLRQASGIRHVDIEQFGPKKGIVHLTLTTPDTNVADILNQSVVLIRNKHEQWQIQLQSTSAESVINIQ